MIVVLSCSCLWPIHWSQVLSWEWRCSWSSADRRCSNYIWVISNFIANTGATYIRGLRVTKAICKENIVSVGVLPAAKESWTCYCPASRTTLVATRFWVVMICPIIKCLTVLEFSFILFDLCLFITIFNFILNYVPIVTFWIFTYHKIWILLIIFCFIWSYWIIYFLTSLEVFWSVVS